MNESSATGAKFQVLGLWRSAQGENSVGRCSVVFETDSMQDLRVRDDYKPKDSDKWATSEFGSIRAKSGPLIVNARMITIFNSNQGGMFAKSRGIDVPRDILDAIVAEVGPKLAAMPQPAPRSGRGGGKKAA